MANYHLFAIFLSFIRGNSFIIGAFPFCFVIWQYVCSTSYVFFFGCTCTHPRTIIILSQSAAAAASSSPTVWVCFSFDSYLIRLRLFTMYKGDSWSTGLASPLANRYRSVATWEMLRLTSERRFRGERPRRFCEDVAAASSLSLKSALRYTFIMWDLRYIYMYDISFFFFFT